MSLVGLAESCTVTTRTTVCRTCEPLLMTASKDYIQQFMAESLAYLVRKVDDIQSLLTFLFTSNSDNANVS